MFKRLCTIYLLAAATVASLGAQQPEACPNKESATFGPKKGQWEVSMMLGRGNNFFNEETAYYLIPSITPNGGSIGLPNGGTDQSGTLPWLNIDGFNGNSLVNIVGLQGKYFFQDCWSLSFSGGLNIGITPSKDYIEGQGKPGSNLVIPDQKYVNAQVNDNWFVNLGVERYFSTGNKRIHPYIGATVGYQMARIHTKEPYTGKMVEDVDGEPIEEAVFLAPGRVGQMFALKGALVGGVEYSFAPGLFMALEFQPVAYRYDVIQIAPQGFDKYNLSHHNIKLVEMPTLRLGFRF